MPEFHRGPICAAVVATAFIVGLASLPSCRKPAGKSGSGDRTRRSEPLTRAAADVTPRPGPGVAARREGPVAAPSGAAGEPACTVSLFAPDVVLDCAFSLCPDSLAARLVSSTEVVLIRDSASRFRLQTTRAEPPFSPGVAGWLMLAEDSLVLTAPSGEIEGMHWGGTCTATEANLSVLRGLEFIRAESVVVRRRMSHP